jgi:hypothetical protein
MVLQHLRTDAAALYAAVRVNRMWFNCVVDLTWNSAANAALRRAAAGHRLANFAKITKLCPFPLRLQGDTGCWYPLLRVLDAPLGGDFLQCNLPLVTATVVELEAPLMAALFDWLRARPPRQLRKLAIYAPDGEGRPGEEDCRDAFFRWLMQQPFPDLASLGLRAVAFPSSWRFAQFLGHCAHSDALTELRLGGPDIVQRVTLDGLLWAQRAMPPKADSVAAKPPPFRHLQRLEAPIDAEAVPTLVELLLRVTHLQLTSGEPGIVVPAVSTMGTQLRLLKLQFDTKGDVAQQHLATLSHLTQLRVLHLSAGKIIGASDVLDVGFLAPMRSLCDLTLLFTAPPPSPTLLGRIGDACRRLQLLRLWGVYFLDQAVEASIHRPLFPLLEELTLGGLDLLELPYLRQASKFPSPVCESSS